MRMERTGFVEKPYHYCSHPKVSPDINNDIKRPGRFIGWTDETRYWCPELAAFSSISMGGKDGA